MALKDHSLDNKIIEAAKYEFLENGYSKTSLHKITERAGITTGALYTRYKNKDALFTSLLESVFSSMSEHAKPIEELYMKALKTKNAEDFLLALRTEEEVYLDLMFQHYDECVLFFCKSAGSSIEKYLSSMMEQKAAQTVAFLKQLSSKDTDLDGIELIMAEQFHIYRMILENKYTKEEATSRMKTVENFLEAGWKDLFQRIL